VSTDVAQFLMDACYTRDIVVFPLNRTAEIWNKSHFLFFEMLQNFLRAAVSDAVMAGTGPYRACELVPESSSWTIACNADAWANIGAGHRVVTIKGPP
jgi:hypothetical protein